MIDCTRFRTIKESKLLHKKKFSNTDCDMTHSVAERRETSYLYRVLGESVADHRKSPPWGGGGRRLRPFKIAGGPQNSGTKADYSKFYDDKSMDRKSCNSWWSQYG